MHALDRFILRRLCGWTAAIVLVAACGEDSSGQVTGQPPPPPETTGDETTSTTGTTDIGTTGASMCPCDPGTFCAAPYVPGQPEPDDSEFTCRDTCVPSGAVSLWCRGDESCCDPEAECTASGVCRLPSTTTATPETDSGTTTTSDTTSSMTETATTNGDTSTGAAETTTGTTTTGN